MRPARSARDNMRKKKEKKRTGMVDSTAIASLSNDVIYRAVCYCRASRYLHLVRCFAFTSRPYIRKCPSASNLRDTVKFFQFFSQTESAILTCWNSPQVKKELSQYLITYFVAPTASNYWKVDISKIIYLIVNLHADFCQLEILNFLKSFTISFWHCVK